MNKKAIGVAIITLILGMGGGYWLAYRHAGLSAKMDHSGTISKQKAKADRKLLFYRNPMNPEVTSTVPAKDSMGMAYIPVYADNAQSGNDPAGTVRIDPVTVQNIGVRTAKAVRQALTREVLSVGRVAYDEKLITRLHPKIKGWIGKVRVSETGQPVKKNEILLSIYSPQLVSSQEEYLLALNNEKTLKDSPFPDIRRGASDLLRSTHDRLELLDVPEHQIRELKKTRKVMKFLHIHSPFDGIAVKIGARDGQYVTPKTQIYMIADLSTVWVYVDIYEYELPWIKLGDEASMKLIALPGQTFTGRIKYIYPYLNGKTRTIRVRLEFKNPDLKLKPNMFADVKIHVQKQADALVIPSKAVLRTGTRNLVFVVRGPGKYEPRDVKLGISSAGLVQILAGVKEGEDVVTSAQFLIDSESKLREAAAKMMEVKKPTVANPRPDMDEASRDMDMKGMNMKKGKK